MQAHSSAGPTLQLPEAVRLWGQIVQGLLGPCVRLVERGDDWTALAVGMQTCIMTSILTVFHNPTYNGTPSPG
jgi:hypothetical protein